MVPESTQIDQAHVVVSNLRNSKYNRTYLFGRRYQKTVKFRLHRLISSYRDLLKTLNYLTLQETRQFYSLGVLCPLSVSG